MDRDIFMALLRVFFCDFVGLLIRLAELVFLYFV